MEENYNVLVQAIVMQAVKDYRMALQALARNPRNGSAKAMKEEVELFFRSDWFGRITDVNPDYLISKLNAEVK